MSILRLRKMEKSKLIFSKKNISNTICVLKIIKEKIPKKDYIAKNNKITTKVKLIEILNQLFQNL